MREFKRPPVVCGGCNACLVWPFSFGSGLSGHDSVEMRGDDDPPAAAVACPRCGSQVGTTEAYAYVPGLPPAFESIKRAYTDFEPKWELNRQSFEDAAHSVISDPKEGLASLENELNTPEGFKWYRQRMFYRSSVAFYRCFQLLLAFLALERRYFRTWAGVTGYYSRFYFIQALLNLLMSSWLELDRVAVVYDGERVKCYRQKDLERLSHRFRKGGSHEIWWSLMESLKRPADYPVDEMGFVLSRFAFNPQARNNMNYSFEYLFGGFNELEWAESGAKQMMSHFMPSRRADQDFTDIDRFFVDADPESADVGDFYGDTEVQSLWCSITAYLRILNALGFPQSFIKTETLVALSELHLAHDYERVRAGIVESISSVLDDGFELAAIEELRTLWRW
jgi:hypothetical protein